MPPNIRKVPISRIFGCCLRRRSLSSSAAEMAAPIIKPDIALQILAATAKATNGEKPSYIPAFLPWRYQFVNYRDSG
jgi:hypothetical protein